MLDFLSVNSAWLEYFADGPNAKYFANVIENPNELLLPTITLLEAFKRVSQQRDESRALQYIATIQQSKLVELSSALALSAAAFGLRYRLPLADSIIYATARQANALVWTQDSDFEGLEGVQFWPKVSNNI